MTKLGPSVFFPWERKPLGLFGRRGVHLRLLLLVLGAVALVSWLRAREEQKAGIRATRAAITTAHNATMSFRADHQGRCPRGAEDLVAGGYLRDVPVDAWGGVLRIECGAAEGESLEVAISSDGPDGLPRGLDQVR